MVTSVLMVIGILVMMVASAFFSGSETALVSANRLKILSLAESGDKRAIQLSRLLNDPDRYLMTLLIGNNIAIISAAVILNNYLVIFHEWDPYHASFFTTATLTTTMLFFSEILPKALFYHWSLDISLRIPAIVQFFYLIFLPFITVLKLITTKFGKLIQLEEDDPMKCIQSKDDIIHLYSMSQSKAMPETRKNKYVQSVLRFEQTTAKEIMIPLTEIQSISLETPPHEALRIMATHHYTRWPIYEKRVDHIVGYIRMTDLYWNENLVSLKDVLVPGIFIPETKKISETLFEMRRKKEKLFFVVNEYGGVSGLISFKDLAEEVVGDILEGKEVSDISVIQDAKEFEVLGETDVDDINEELHLSIKKDGFETIGGYICYLLGKIPERGEVINTSQAVYTVIEADSKSIKRLRIHRIHAKRS